MFTWPLTSCPCNRIPLPTPRTGCRDVRDANALWHHVERLAHNITMFVIAEDPVAQPGGRQFFLRAWRA